MRSNVRWGSSLICRVNKFLMYDNEVIRKQYPNEARINANVLQIIKNGRTMDAYAKDLLASHMCIPLQHPDSQKVYGFFNEYIRD